MAEEEKEEKKSSKLMPIIIGAVGGIVLLLLGLGIGYFIFSSPPTDPSAEVDEIIEKSNGEEEGEEECIDDETTEINECSDNPEKIALDTPENQVFLTKPAPWYDLGLPIYLRSQLTTFQCLPQRIT